MVLAEVPYLVAEELAGTAGTGSLSGVLAAIASGAVTPASVHLAVERVTTDSLVARAAAHDVGDPGMFWDAVARGLRAARERAHADTRGAVDLATPDRDPRPGELPPQPAST